MKKNFVFIAIVLLVALGCFVAFRLASGTGRTALVTVTDADSVEIQLSKDGVYHIDTGKLPVTLVVADGGIYFTNSRCPDHVCEGFGVLRNEGEQAICLPAGVVVTVE